MLAAPLPHAQSSSPASEQADAYLAQARRALESGSAESAREMIETALVLAPDDSEALYLRAVANQGDRARTRAVRGDLVRALAVGSWRKTDPGDADLALADILLRTGVLTDAQLVLDRLAREKPEDPRTLLLAARLQAKKGAAAREQKALADGILRFPRVEDFPLSLSRSLERSGKVSAARSLVATALKELPDSLPLILRAAELERNPARRLKTVDLYLSKAGADPLAPLLALEARPKNAAKYLALVLELEGLARVDIAERAFRAAAGKKDLSATLAGALARFSGFRELDQDGDGFSDERWGFSAGEVVRWVRDRDQDGVPELEADFQKGEPAVLRTEAAGASRLAYQYSRYPWLHSVSEFSAGLTRTSLLTPYLLSAPFLDSVRAGTSAAAGMAPRTLPHVTLPTREQLAKATWRAEERSEDGGVLARRLESAKGTTTYVEEDLDRDGRIDHRLWYENGSPVRGARDLTGDGIFEATEIYRNGKLWRDAVDTDGSGIPDYAEVFGAAPARFWDYNEDGNDDSRASEGRGGTEVREFSTRLDGVFDLTVVFRAGQIVEVRRSGKPVAVSAEPGRGITWIGSPGKAAGLDKTTPDGFQSLGGKRYLVFRYAGTVYAEELK
jgi:tetratricopeptide (TPR) repeat protein